MECAGGETRGDDEGGGLSGSSLGGDVEGKVLVLTEVKQGEGWNTGVSYLICWVG